MIVFCSLFNNGNLWYYEALCLSSWIPRPPRPKGEDSLEQLLQIPSLGIKHLFHLKRMFVVKKVLFEWKRRLDQEFEATVPERLSPVGRCDLGMRLGLAREIN